MGLCANSCCSQEPVPPHPWRFSVASTRYNSELLELLRILEAGFRFGTVGRVRGLLLRARCTRFFFGLICYSQEPVRSGCFAIISWAPGEDGYGCRAGVALSAASRLCACGGPLPAAFCIHRAMGSTGGMGVALSRAIEPRSEGL